MDVIERARKDVPGKGVVNVLVHQGNSLPPWVWLPWLGQLIPMLARSEVNAARTILRKVAQVYPQALFFGLKAFMEERRVIDHPTRNLTAEVSKLHLANVPTGAAGQQAIASATNIVDHAQSRR